MFFFNLINSRSWNKKKIVNSPSLEFCCAHSIRVSLERTYIFSTTDRIHHIYRMQYALTACSVSALAPASCLELFDETSSKILFFYSKNLVSTGFVSNCVCNNCTEKTHSILAQRFLFVFMIRFCSHSAQLRGAPRGTTKCPAVIILRWLNR